jgi:uncharacterized repeat protein (TIGR03803 family)
MINMSGAAIFAIASILGTTQAQTFTVLHTFAGYPTDGAEPGGGRLASDTAGNLYGTTTEGGAGNCVSENRTVGCGSVFKLQGDTVTLLHSFSKGAGGYLPQSNAVLDSAGNLYGTTLYDGDGVAGGKGIVYELQADGNEVVLHTFRGSPDGQAPYGELTRAPDGALFGTTRLGGNGQGTVFKISPAGKESILHSFSGGDGANPYGGVIRDRAGNLYGTTYIGGSSGNGVVFKLAPDGTETLLYNFTGGADGGNPIAPLILDSAGNLYGTTSFGGIASNGVVFKVSPSGTETVLYSFTGMPDGSAPVAPLARDAAGNLYGTTNLGGASDRGAVFKLDMDNNETVLYSFTGGKDGSYPEAGLYTDRAGNLYGTSAGDGRSNAGAVFEIQP